MAKIPFSKLKITKDVLDKEDGQITFNDQTVIIKGYLPIAEKAQLLTNVLNNSVENEGYYNTLIMSKELALGIVQYYTNITFTKAQLDDKDKLYDLLVASGLMNKIIALMPDSEFAFLNRTLHEQADSIYKYRNSALGILEAAQRDYNNLDLDATKISEELSNPENLTLLKDVVSKLG